MVRVLQKIVTDQWGYSSVFTKFKRQVAISENGHKSFEKVSLQWSKRIQKKLSKMKNSYIFLNSLNWAKNLIMKIIIRSFTIWNTMMVKEYKTFTNISVFLSSWLQTMVHVTMISGKASRYSHRHCICLFLKQKSWYHT